MLFFLKHLCATVEDVPDEDNPPSPSPSQTALEDLFTAVLDGLVTDNLLDKSVMYKAAMALPYSAQWHATLKEEFASLRELGVHKLVLHSSVPASHIIMHGKPVFKLKWDQDRNPV
ncbi:hypothetical protein PAXRUDRAFT_18052 [Paxillus rubicundulus Ve08.2h10]|uniref:Uncharacterized protein n=1 Tax=Paxillus rubicundulus Ve08.2h10 TaxID=930991 RepID=A0A0D0CMV2_9AGAM|nr:hypothetical protein PAXRUDRAFT_18052 [Paxillus rubicundulus Ve08.2h10]